MATTVIKTVNAGGGGDYLTLQHWASGQKGNLVTRDTIEIAELQGNTTHASGFQLMPSDWTVDKHHYVQIRAASGWNHPGVFDRTKSYLGLKTPLDIQVGFTRIGPGMCMYPNLDYGNPINIHVRNIADNAPVVIDGLCLRKYGSPCIKFENCLGHISGHVVKSCEFVNSTSNDGFILADGPRTHVYVRNCTAIGSLGILKSTNGGRIFSQNNYLGGTTGTTCYAGSGVTKGSHDVTFNNEATDVARQNKASTLDQSLFYFMNQGAPGWHEGQTGIADLHLSSGSFLIGRGLDLSDTHPALFIPQFGADRISRTAGAWDVGVDEYTVPTSSVKHVGADQEYTTIAAWIAARKGNLANRDTIETVLIHDSQVAQVDIKEEDWGVNTKNYIIIKAAPGQAHSGVFTANHAYIKMPNGLTGGATLFKCGVGGTRIGPGLVIDATATIAGGFGSHICVSLLGESAAPMHVEGNIIKVGQTGGDWAPYGITGGTVNYNKHWDNTYIHSHHIIRNNVVSLLYAPYGYGINVAGGFKVYNNTIVCLAAGNTYGIRMGAYGSLSHENNNYIRAINNYSAVGLTKGANTATHNTEAASASLRSIAFSTANFINVTAGSEDLHLQDTSVLLRKGETLSDVPTDMVGTVRLSGIYDIGADQHSLTPLSTGFFTFMIGAW